MRALAEELPPICETWKVVSLPAGASFQPMVKVMPFCSAVTVWAYVAESSVASLSPASAAVVDGTSRLASAVLA